MDAGVADIGTCIICLTCDHRCHPGTIDWPEDPQPDMCGWVSHAGGICESEGPKDAVPIGDVNDAAMIDPIPQSISGNDTNASTILVIGCPNGGSLPLWMRPSACRSPRTSESWRDPDPDRQRSIMAGEP